MQLWLTHYLSYVSDALSSESRLSWRTIALLQLALLSDIPFPCLLLVDTPEIAGIDLEGLVKMLRQIDALENPNIKRFQILFSTGEGKYPSEFASKVVLKLSKEDRLPVRRDALPSGRWCGYFRSLTKIGSAMASTTIGRWFPMRVVVRTAYSGVTDHLFRKSLTTCFQFGA